jgi:hypothetical protein
LRDALHKPLRQPSSTGRISQADHSAPNKDSDHIQNDRGRCRLLVTLTTGARSRRYPIPCHPRPASWWERMHLGASDEAIGSEAARLVFTHILHRLIDQETATDALRQPSARARIATAVGGLRQRARKCSSRIVMMRTPDSANHSKSLGQDYLTWKSSHFDEMFRKVSALARLFNLVETSS